MLVNSSLRHRLPVTSSGKLCTYYGLVAATSYGVVDVVDRSYLGLGFVGKIGFEYSATEVFEYSNTYEYFAPCFIKQPPCIID